MINKNNKMTKTKYPLEFWHSISVCISIVYESFYMNRIAIDFSPLILLLPRLLFLFFLFLWVYFLLCTQDNKRRKKESSFGKKDRREQDAFRTHLIVKMMVDINSRMLFLSIIFIIISLTIGQQQQRRSSVTIGNTY